MQAVESVSDGRCAVEAADYHRNSRPVYAARKRGFFEGSTNRAKSLLRRSITGCQPEFPIFYQVTPVVPFVCPGENYDPAAAQLEGRSDLPFQGGGLFLLVVAKAVEANFAEQHGTVIAKVV